MSDYGQRSSRMAGRVFVGHAPGDRVVVEEIAAALATAGFEVWFESWALEAGESMKDLVRDVPTANDFLVVVLSPDSVESRWVREELAIVLTAELRQRAITIVPIVVRDCDIPLSLRSLPLVDLRAGSASGISQLIERLSLARDVDFSLLDPRRFEELVADVMRAEGFSVRVSMATMDGGHDLLLTPPATSGETETERNLISVQIKHYGERRVSVDTIRSSVGSVVLAGEGTRGLIVSSSQLTSAAEELVSAVNRKGLLRLDVIDGPTLERKVLAHPQMVQKYFRGSLKE